MKLRNGWVGRVLHFRCNQLTCVCDNQANLGSRNTRDATHGKERHLENKWAKWGWVTVSRLTKNTNIAPQKSSLTASHLISGKWELKKNSDTLSDLPLIGDIQNKSTVFKVDIISILPEESRNFPVCPQRWKAWNELSSWCYTLVDKYGPVKDSDIWE